MYGLKPVPFKKRDFFISLKMAVISGKGSALRQVGFVAKR
jgi:hypothetical protein